MGENDIKLALRRYDVRTDEAMNGMNDFMARQARGEHPDSQEFFALVQKRVTAQQAMEAQIKLAEKPQKTALQEAR